ncbi:MAG: ABC transporter substrate-binding protein [Acidimicrobiia bacterium]|nr:MAG: ABC transporter substrate-binding protein [Acidimicrobiia bacterium]
MAKSRLGKTKSLVAVSAVVALFAVACSPTEADSPSVVVTTSILGDVVTQLGVEAPGVLMPPGVDPHDFAPSAQQVAEVRRADLVVTVGLGLEPDALADAVSAAREDGVRVLAVGEEIEPLRAGGGGPCPLHESVDEAPDEGHAHGDCDPHFWHDPLRMAAAAEVIANSLAELRPEIGWQGRAAAYRAELEALHAELEQQYRTIPEERRKLVTSHDSFRYLAERYGFQIVGVILPGGDTHARPSPRELAELVAAMRRENVRVVFVEPEASHDLAEALSAELEGLQVVELFSDSLGPAGSDADTYVGMMRENARRIVEALR